MNKCLMCLLAILFASSQTYAQDYASLKGIVTNPNASELSRSTQTYLDSLFAMIGDAQYIHEIKLNATAANTTIAEQNLKPMQQALESYGVLPQKILSSTAIANNEELQLEIAYTPMLTSVDVVVQAPKTRKIYCAGRTKKAQEFKVQASREMRVKGKEGTEVAIPMLVDADGNRVSGEVTIELKEFYKNSDIVLNDLFTETNGELLQTGGMIYLNATSSDGEQLYLGSNATVKMPTKNADADMRLYTGEETADGSVNWVKQGGESRMMKGSLSTGLSIREIQVFDRYDYKFENSNINKKKRNSYPNRYSKKRYKTKQIYELSIPKLGWINCDKLLDKKSAIELEVKVTGELLTGVSIDGDAMKEIPKVSAYITALPSMLSGSAIVKKDGIYVVFRVPANYEINIVGMTATKDGSVAYAKQVVNTKRNKDMKLELNLKKVSNAALQQDLASLDN
ncbi:MAG: hypothetical protein GY810_06855 [Aureispira sp.]|nr:hypothetical protein [Aureispira sp.]